MHLKHWRALKCNNVASRCFYKIKYKRYPAFRVAGVGWLSCTAAESLRAFVVRVFANFRDKNIVFLRLQENRQFVVVKRLTHTQARSLKHPFRCLDMYFYFTMQTCSESTLKALRKLSESGLSKSRIYESSTKTLRKQALRGLYECSPRALNQCLASVTFHSPL